MTQRDLAAKSGLSESMVSRMFKNLNGRGDTFDLTERMVYKIALGLNLGKKGLPRTDGDRFPRAV